ncbi:MAG: hypothetical protein IKX92_02140, partial [Clostridia bacterium]|nr:hypothetical protein [Clostridia bacterium]
MKRLIALLLCAAFIFAFAACGGVSTETSGSAPEPAESSAPAESAESAEPREHTKEQYFEEHEDEYPWQGAFYDYEVEKGWVTAGTLSLCYPNEDGTAEVVNVPFDEVREFSAAGKGIPRTHFYDGYFSETYKEYVLPAYDYAAAHGCLDFAFATDHVSRDEIECTKSTDGVTSLQTLNSIAGFNDTEIYARHLDWYRKNGHELIFWRFTVLEEFRIPDQITLKRMSDHKKAVDEAARLVENLDPRFTDYQKALWLYRYVTENVKFAGETYYDDGTYNYLYDALIKKSTVCTGYSAALYCLFNMAGIDCICINVSGGGFGHEWNAAKLGDKYYHFDATSDGGLEIENYASFGVSTDTLRISDSEELNQSVREAIKTAGEAGAAPVCDSELSEVWNKDDSGIVW